MTIDTILYLILGGFVVLVISLVYLVLSLRKTITKRDEEISKKDNRIEKGYGDARQLGINQIRGGLMELMGDFALLVDYDHLAVIASATAQFPLDVIGIVEEDDDEVGGKGKARVDFVEFKSGFFSADKSIHKKDTYDFRSVPEKGLKKLIDDGKVHYVIKEVNLPEWFKEGPSTRDMEARKQKIMEEKEKEKN